MAIAVKAVLIAAGFLFSIAARQTQQEVPDGLDFHWGSKSNAMAMMVGPPFRFPLFADSSPPTAFPLGAELSRCCGSNPVHNLQAAHFSRSE